MIHTMWYFCIQLPVCIHSIYIHNSVWISMNFKIFCLCAEYKWIFLLLLFPKSIVWQLFTYYWHCMRHYKNPQMTWITQEIICKWCVNTMLLYIKTVSTAEFCINWGCQTNASQVPRKECNLLTNNGVHDLEI